MKKPKRVKAVSDGKAVFVIVGGVKVARRGHPDSPQAKTWVSLEPGWTVRGGDERDANIIVEHNGVRVQ
jgi:hypothetical protein